MLNRRKFLKQDNLEKEFLEPNQMVRCWGLEVAH